VIKDRSCGSVAWGVEQVMRQSRNATRQQTEGSEWHWLKRVMSA
jgi:hypothetical protein